ncbi:MAG: UDP-N-acetylmuramoyl-L-alanyl-D-glutamate--2,6-diaminopimelate ligase [Pseudomonadota bacterium]
MMAAKLDKTMRLDTLLAGIAPAPATEISGLTLDSKTLVRGSAFVAVQGATRHGFEFVDEALSRDAAAVITDLPETDLRVQALRRKLPVVSVAEDLRLPALLGSRFYAQPGDSLRIAAVTGTNGKSSISWLIAAALRAHGERSAIMGTLGSGPLRALRSQSLTTPDAITVQRRLSEFLGEGVTHVALEASSHALVQQRLAHSDIDIAVFSNLSRDHLDYHGSMDDYFEAKASLFEQQGLRDRIIATDDIYGQQLWQRYSDVAIQVSSTAIDDLPARFVCVRDAVQSVAGTQLTLSTDEGDVEVCTRLIGQFNIQNVCLAFAALRAHGLDPAAAADALADALPPPGRLQRVASGSPAVFVDFAHTPEALSLVLETLREGVSGKLICVFGCGGDRDKGKRPQMAAAAEAGADHLVLTSDNPRTEAIEEIIDGMLKGLTKKPSRIEFDRRAAIRAAIEMANDDDVVVIAGKGHEKFQVIDGQSLPFDDVLEARIALRDSRGVVG